MGGLLSLEMAHQIAIAARTHSNGNGNGNGYEAGRPAPQFRVVGMIFIDSIFPLRLGELRGPMPTQPSILSAKESQAMKIKDKVNVNMTHARMMVGFWEVPQWKWSGKDIQVPPTILFRAKEFVNEDPSQNFVDYVRDFKLLGWDEYSQTHGNFIQDVIPVEGHHFSIFDMKNVSLCHKYLRMIGV